MASHSQQNHNKESTTPKGVSRFFVFSVCVITLLLAIGGALILFQSQLRQSNLAQSLVQSEDSIRLNHLKTAWLILKELPTPDKKNPLFSNWYHQITLVSIGLKMTDRLVTLKAMDPIRFSECEGAENALFDGIRGKHNQSSNGNLGSLAKEDCNQDLLFLSKADEYWLKGDKERAIILLQGSKAHGIVEIRRLLRLAILCENDNALFAEYLKQAVGEAFKQLANPADTSTEEINARQNSTTPTTAVAVAMKNERSPNGSNSDANASSTFFTKKNTELLLSVNMPLASDAEVPSSNTMSEYPELVNDNRFHPDVYRTPEIKIGIQFDSLNSQNEINFNKPKNLFGFNPDKRFFQ